MKNRIIFLCPYFGKINKEHMRLWLKCCEKNKDIDFLFVADDSEFFECSKPENVKCVYMSWEECKNLVQEHFEFPISMVYAYKLCDFRPAFGLVFADYIKDYDFWGHIDFSDTILGDLQKFISDDILDKYDKIHIYGHLTLFRNTEENNNRFKIPSSTGLTIKDIFSVEENVCFDDMYQRASINRIYKENNFPLIEEIPNLVADILPHDFCFSLAQDKGRHIPRAFEWNDGNLFELTVADGQTVKREIGYVHFQKRKVCNETSHEAYYYYFVPNRFIDAKCELSAKEIEEFSKNKLYLEPLKGRIKRLKWYANHPSAFKRKLKERF